MKEKPEHPPIEKRKRKTVNMMKEKIKQQQKRDERDLLEFSPKWCTSKKRQKDQ